MSKLQALPLFPLNTVLFPGMVLPLHIFEPRYRLMIGRCFKENTPFGVVLIREGQEIGGPATPHEIGTSAYVTRLEPMDDGRLNVQSIGYQRFKIHSLRHNKPYLVGMVEDYPVRGEKSAGVRALVAEMVPVLRRYLEVLNKATDASFSLEKIPSDGAAMAFLVAIVLPLDNDEKQKLLALEDVTSMLELEQKLLRRELALLDHMRARSPERRDPGMPFSAS
jgi:Lon protease-like protein